MSVPVVAIVGRPNVGKSTLFNRIVGSRKALVASRPGVTRDRNIASTEWEECRFVLVDTGGFNPDDSGVISKAMQCQARIAMDESDVTVLLLDNRAGLLPGDIELYRILQRARQPLVVAVNKTDSAKQENNLGEFWRLGVSSLLPVSAEHGLGVGDLLDQVISLLPATNQIQEETPSRIRIAVVGRPNVGKSSLVNRILRAERLIVSDLPGTTRDAIDTPLSYDGRDLLMIDTAGIRRRGRVGDPVEKLCVLKALKAIERAHAVFMMVDANAGILEHDLKIAGLIHERRRACIWVANKWDLAKTAGISKVALREEIRFRARFHRYTAINIISAATGMGVNKLLPAVAMLYERASQRIDTAPLNDCLARAFKRHTPPSHHSKVVKLFYATQIRVRPPTFVLFLNHPQAIDLTYRRYLENRLRDAFDFEGVPLRLQFRARSRRKRKSLPHKRGIRP